MPTEVYWIIYLNGSSGQIRARLEVRGCICHTHYGHLTLNSKIAAMNLDHAVLWVEDANRALEFYIEILGLDPVRAKEFAEGKARFPSVRLNDKTIFDIMEYQELLSLVQKFTGGEGVGGSPINHLCLSMNEAEYNSVYKRLENHGIKLMPGGEDVFGAQGQAVRSTYFNDPDGNVLEIRYYDGKE